MGVRLYAWMSVWMFGYMFGWLAAMYEQSQSNYVCPLTVFHLGLIDEGDVVWMDIWINGFLEDKKFAPNFIMFWLMRVKLYGWKFVRMFGYGIWDFGR